VKSGDVLAEVETDKAIMELVARGDGVLRKRLLDENATAAVGTLIAVIATPDEKIDDLTAGAPAAQQAPAAAPSPPATQSPAPAAAPRRVLQFRRQELRASLKRPSPELRAHRRSHRRWREGSPPSEAWT
jgi:pyruvate/2-oxoglutarate dehydrogenase complex dihydrolipoamide acyltransferase (E2) component